MAHYSCRFFEFSRLFLRWHPLAIKRFLKTQDQPQMKTPENNSSNDVGEKRIVNCQIINYVKNHGNDIVLRGLEKMSLLYYGVGLKASIDEETRSNASNRASVLA